MPVKSLSFRMMTSMLFLVALVSCSRREATSWDTNLNGPIAFGRLSLEQIVADSLLQADESGLWHLIFDENLTDFELDSIVEIPDTTIVKEYPLFLVGDFPPGFTVPIAPTQQITIQHPSVQLKKVRMKGGKLKYRLRSPVDGYLNCTFTIPGLTRDGISQSIAIATQPPQSSQEFVTEGELDLAGLELDLTGESGSSFNRIAATFSVVVDANAPQSANVSPGDVIDFELQFADPKVSYARGYFGSHYYALNEHVDFSALANMPDGVLNLEQASMQFSIRNAVGIDAQIDFSEISNYNQLTQTTVALQHPTLFEPLNITRAHDNGGVVDAYEYHYDVNASNSNLDAFFENLPSQFQLQGDVTINPLGNVSDGNDFVYTDDALQAGFSVDIPLKIGLQNIHLADTLFLSNTAPEIPLNGKLLLWISNGYPVEASVNLYIIENGQRVVLAEGVLINSATPTSTSNLAAPAESWIEIETTEEKLAKLNEENPLLIDVVLHTPGAPTPVGLYAHQFIDFRLIVDGTYTLQYGQ
jgi:hypothetical protein